MNPAIVHNFTYHGRRGRVADFTAIREKAKELAELIDKTVEEDAPQGGREKALAITKIEEAVMWANAALARHGSHQPESPLAKR